MTETMNLVSRTGGVVHAPLFAGRQDGWQRTRCAPHGVTNKDIAIKATKHPVTCKKCLASIAKTPIIEPAAPPAPAPTTPARYGCGDCSFETDSREALVAHLDDHAA